jgi:hypothetical protein
MQLAQIKDLERLACRVRRVALDVRRSVCAVATITCSRCCSVVVVRKRQGAPKTRCPPCDRAARAQRLRDWRKLNPERATFHNGQWRARYPDKARRAVRVSHARQIERRGRTCPRRSHAKDVL